MTTVPTPAPSAGLIDRLHQLIIDSGPAANKHDLAIISIEVCIAEGVDTKPHIIGVLRSVGFKPGHVARILDDCARSLPGGNHWHLDKDGRYSLQHAA